jgi:hypothetical protein
MNPLDVPKDITKRKSLVCFSLMLESCESKSDPLAQSTNSAIPLIDVTFPDRRWAMEVSDTMYMPTVPRTFVKYTSRGNAEQPGFSSQIFVVLESSMTSKPQQFPVKFSRPFLLVVVVVVIVLVLVLVVVIAVVVLVIVLVVVVVVVVVVVIVLVVLVIVLVVVVIVLVVVVVVVVVVIIVVVWWWW